MSPTTTSTIGRIDRASGSLGRFAGVFLVAMHLAVLLVFITPFSWSLVALALGSYVVRMWAVTTGYHRYFAHRSFKTSRAFQLVLAILGATTMQGGPLWWAKTHRRHHKFSDTTEDVHSPVQRGFFYAHIGWLYDKHRDAKNLDELKDLSRFPELGFVDRHEWLPLIGWAGLCYAIAGWPGVVWGFFVSTIVLLHATFLINSLAHVWGTRRYATPDQSRNNLLLAILTLGEGWHNNHHHSMSSARQGFFWWEIDVSYYVLRLLKLLGVVWDVREPTAAAKRSTVHSETASTPRSDAVQEAFIVAHARGEGPPPLRPPTLEPTESLGPIRNGASHALGRALSKPPPPIESPPRTSKSRWRTSPGSSRQGSTRPRLRTAGSRSCAS